MVKIYNKKYELFFSISVGIILAVLVFLIIKPFLNALLTGMILAYLSYSLYKLIKKKIKNETIAALLTIFIVLIVVVIPLFYAANSIAHEANRLYIFSRTNIFGHNITENACINEKSLRCQIITLTKKVFESATFKTYITEFSRDVYLGFSQGGKSIISFFTNIFINLFIIIVTMYFMLKDGKKMLNYTLKIIPVDRKLENRFIKKFKDLTYAVVYGQIITALIQGILASFLFWIFGIEAPLIWGFITFIVSILPFIGPSLVYIPMGLFKIFQGLVVGNSTYIWFGSAIIITGFALVSSVDNIVKVKITGAKAKQHPLVVLIGVLGGFKLFGFVGLFFGPLVLVFALAFLEVISEKNETKD